MWKSFLTCRSGGTGETHQSYLARSSLSLQTIRIADIRQLKRILRLYNAISFRGQFPDVFDRVNQKTEPNMIQRGHKAGLTRSDSSPTSLSSCEWLTSSSLLISLSFSAATSTSSPLLTSGLELLLGCVARSSLASELGSITTPAPQPRTRIVDVAPLPSSAGADGSSWIPGIQ
jgi:hypothetical protein